MEKWKPIKGFEGRYSVSSKGRIYSHFLKKIMSFYINNSGYACIDFSVKGERSRYTVHRLVALHFCGGYKDGLHVNHIDGDKLNNNYTNLEWVTAKENIHDMITRGVLDVRTAQKVAQKKNQKPVAMLCTNGSILQIFTSAKEAEEKTGTRRSKISLVCNGHRKTTNGYKWKFIRDKEIV
jgi:hypothetical protein